VAKIFDAAETSRALRDAIENDVAETALAVLSKVVQATPVGNPTRWQNPASAPEGYVGGHARRNWIVSRNTPVSTVKGTAGDGGGAGRATAEATREGSRRIAANADARRLIIQNNVPYINRLNAGHSTTAPANFVEKAIQAARIVGDRREELP